MVQLFRRLRTWFQNSFSYIWLVVFAVYISVLAGQAMYRNYTSQKETDALKQQLVDAKLDKERWEALLVYYNTDAYKEKVLRESLLLRKPDEKVYALPESGVSQQAEQVAIARKDAADPRKSLPTWRQWVEYLFGSTARS
jgi:hypothetical protein